MTTTDVAEKRTINLTTLANSSVREEIEVPDGIHIMTDVDEIPVGHNMFRILSQEKGDERLTWDSTSLRELQAAKQLFVNLIKRGLKPFRVGINGMATSSVMDEFDPYAEEVIFLPQSLVVGG
tara:strand:- start:935 stop:1303 length:369 start_codon:yes stop_codon:yes gene_type:complete